VQLKQAGQPIKMHPNTSPGLAYTRLPVGITLNESLVGAFADENGYIQLYSPSLLGTSWNRISIPYQSSYLSVGRPVLAWVGAPPTQSPGGSGASASITANRFYMLYLEPQTPPPNHPTPTNKMRMQMSYVGANGTLQIGLDSYFDNEWAYAYGIGVLQPSVSKFRTVFTSAVPNSLRGVFFRPNADGISDLTYRNFDDWKTLGRTTCTTVTATQTGPLACPPPW
jgi:hypothetical protein